MRTEITARRRPLKMALLVLWLAAFAFVVSGAVAALTAPEPYQPMIVMVVWLLMWMAGAVVAIGSLAWMLWGREIVVMTATTLTIRRQIGPIGRTRSFDLAKVSDIRAGAGGMAFDYRSRPVRFGADLDRDGADELAARMAEAAKTGLTPPL